jgi:hypothetical protein
MDSLLRSSANRAPQSQQIAKSNAPVTTPTPSRHRKTRRKMFIGIVVGIICLAAAVVLGSWWMARNSEAAQVKSDRYQSVFLTNGQVYFGKITDLNGSYVRISDIYYLQVQQAVQPTDGKEDTSTTDASSKPQLVKLGNELHAPEDAMQINRDQVLFWENIKPDGQVAKAIGEFTKK